MAVARQRVFTDLMLSHEIIQHSLFFGQGKMAELVNGEDQVP